MENRSFDHILGWLKKTRSDIDGLTGDEFNHIAAFDPKSEKVFVSDDSVFVDSDPGHSYQAIREQIFGSNDSSKIPAPMNGFAQQANSMQEGLAKTVMSGFKPEVLPVYTELANEFAVFDRYFEVWINWVYMFIGFVSYLTIICSVFNSHVCLNMIWCIFDR